MGKKEELLQQLGGNMGESIGVQRASVHGEPAAVKETVQPSDKYRGRTRSPASGEMKLDRIVPDPGQPRKQFDADELNRLSASIQKNGVLQPIRVRWTPELSKWVIVYGERRFRAALQAGLEKIPCLFDENEADESSVRILQITENCLRSDLTPIEQADSFRSLIELTGWSTQRLASELNIGKASVIRALAILKLPEKLRKSVDTGELAPSVAYMLSRVNGNSRQRKLFRTVVDRGLTRDEAQSLIAASQPSKPRPPAPAAIEPSPRPPNSTDEPPKTIRRFETRRAVVIVEHEDPQASESALQAAILAVVKQIGATVAKSDREE